MSLTRAIHTVLLGTIAAGFAGGCLGAVLGRTAPGFFVGLAGTGAGGSDPTETALALGAITGLVLGAIGCVVLAAVKMWGEDRRVPQRAEESEESA